jgi:broad specificity phosphatase PhoE
MTAEALLASGVSAAEVIPDDRLVEQNFGRFHGRPIAEVWDQVKDEPKSNWHFLHHEFRPPDGESFVMLHKRMAPVLSAVKTAEIERLILVGHAMTTKSLVAHALNLSPEQALALVVSPLSLTRMTFIRPNHPDPDAAGEWQIDWLNRVYSD